MPIFKKKHVKKSAEGKKTIYERCERNPERKIRTAKRYVFVSEKKKQIIILVTYLGNLIFFNSEFYVHFIYICFEINILIINTFCEIIYN